MATIVLAWCASPRPVDHYSVYRNVQPEVALHVTKGPNQLRTTVAYPTDQYHVIGYRHGHPIEWVESGPPDTLECPQ